MIPGIMADMLRNRMVILLGVLLLTGCVTGQKDDEDSGASGGDAGPPKKDQKVKPGDGAPADQKGLVDLPPVMPNPHKGETTRQGWARIRPGWFYMGSPTSEYCRDSKEEVLHKVTLTREFEMMQAEVTQGAFTTKMGKNPTDLKDRKCGNNCPVAAVSWNGAVAYCNELSKEMKLELCYDCTGTVGSSIQCGYNGKFHASNPIYNCKGFRLATEAEWEYAYRAGSSSGYFNGRIGSSKECLDCSSTHIKPFGVAWYCGNSQNIMRPIKGKQPNRWLLYDMAGSAMEWVDDWYVENLGSGPRTNPWRDQPGPKKTRVLRGGSWLSPPSYIRAA